MDDLFTWEVHEPNVTRSSNFFQGNFKVQIFFKCRVFLKLLFALFFAVLGTEGRVSHMLGKHFITNYTASPF